MTEHELLVTVFDDHVTVNGKVLRPGPADKVQRTLDAVMDASGNDAGAATIREYLASLLHELFRQGADFSGKRPFGHSGWEADLELALVKAHLITGRVNSDDQLVFADYEEASNLLHAAIGRMGGEDFPYEDDSSRDESEEEFDHPTLKGL